MAKLKNYPKDKRVVSPETIKRIMERQCTCLVGFSGNHGFCSGEDCPHHIISRGAGGGDVEGNIIRVCIKHHQEIHNGLISRETLYEYLKEFDV